MARAAALSSFEEQAIEWLVEMRSGRAGERERAALAHWLCADPRHRQAWQRLGGALDATFDSGGRAPDMRASTVDAALQRATARAGGRRRMLRGALGLGGVGLGTAWLAQGSGLLPDWRADLHTATGERRSVTLADGSHLELDARTSVDIDFRAGQRTILLRQGQLLARLGSTQEPPFVARSRHGEARAQGTRFLLRQEQERTLALALEGDLALRSGGESALLQPGRSAYLDGSSVAMAGLPAIPEAATAWVRGLLQAEDMPLGEVLAALKPYRLGFMRVSPQAARLRVTGVYGLDDSDATLQALADTLPIAIHRHSGGWLVRVELAG
ncbi:FecR domain-containing protein [Comamonas antarctica]|uniref:FecR domain-containing protein n=1 Tax=Comamonas antarctica TaxID=2743470 RepID=UPI0028E80892|nr:FecR domain-containing protein [Comamonas antarctica]